MLITPLNYSFKNIFFEELWLFEEVCFIPKNSPAVPYIFYLTRKGKWVKK